MTPVFEERTRIKHSKYGNYDKFVEEFFACEITAAIIGEDYSCSYEDGFHLAWLSEPYGFFRVPVRWEMSDYQEITVG